MGAPAQPAGTDRTASDLTLSDIVVSYAARSVFGRPAPVLHGVSLEVRPGEIVGLAGESGSGKSTAGLVSLGLLRPQEGVVRVLGREWAERGARLRSDVQAIWQDPLGSLDPIQPIGKGLRELRRIHGARCDWTTDVELLHRVGLAPEILERRPRTLSGGQAQRVGVARAVLSRPALLIADEPTSALDVTVQAQVVRLLLRLRAEMELSVLLISHDLALMRQICDRMYMMYQGRIVEAGTTEKLLGSPTHEHTRHLVASVARFRDPDEPIGALA